MRSTKGDHFASNKSLIDSFFSYTPPIWFPNTFASNISKLQVFQNTALRIATGCPMMASVDHLHTKAEVLTVREHLDNGHAMCPVPSHLPPAVPALLSYCYCGLRPQEHEANTPTSILCTSGEFHRRGWSDCRSYRCSGSHPPRSSEGIIQGQRYQ